MSHWPPAPLTPPSPSLPPSPGPTLRLPQPQQLVAVLPQHAPAAAPAPAEPGHAAPGPARSPRPTPSPATERAGPSSGGSGAGGDAHGRGAVGGAGGQWGPAPQWAPGGAEWGCCPQPCRLEPGRWGSHAAAARLSQQVRGSSAWGRGRGGWLWEGFPPNTHSPPKGKMSSNPIESSHLLAPGTP